MDYSREESPSLADMRKPKSGQQRWLGCSLDDRAKAENSGLPTVNSHIKQVGVLTPRIL